jgi:hypothetical protein
VVYYIAILLAFERPDYAIPPVLSLLLLLLLYQSAATIDSTAFGGAYDKTLPDELLKVQRYRSWPYIAIVVVTIEYGGADEHGRADSSNNNSNK